MIGFGAAANIAFQSLQRSFRYQRRSALKMIVTLFFGQHSDASVAVY
jgi:hypothetical protein